MFTSNALYPEDTISLSDKLDFRFSFQKMSLLDLDRTEQI